MMAWHELEAGWREWARLEASARWRYDEGVVSAVSHDGYAIPLNGANWSPTIRKLWRMHARRLKVLGATDWERRALIAIMAIEDGRGTIPAYGPWVKDGKAVPADTEGAFRASGLYQIIPSTADAIGVPYGALARDIDTNHRAGLKLLRNWRPVHGDDFVTLAVLWNAGSVRPGDPPWGVKMWEPTLLSTYVSAWNAAQEPFTMPDVPAPGDGFGRAMLALAAWGVAKVMRWI